jgi:hypothetical protein
VAVTPAEQPKRAFSAMSARDDFPVLARFAGGFLPNQPEGREVAAVFDEIDQLRAEREYVLRWFRAARKSAALFDAVREWSRSSEARGGPHDRLQDAWDAYSLDGGSER